MRCGAALTTSSADALDVMALQDVDVTPAVALIGLLAFVSLSLLIFNLIPAFPLDGGRIARAIAWKITGDGSWRMMGSSSDCS